MVDMSVRQEREIRRLLRVLRQPVPVDLVGELGIVDAWEYIGFLRSCAGLRRG